MLPLVFLALVVLLPLTAAMAWILIAWPCAAPEGPDGDEFLGAPSQSQSWASVPENVGSALAAGIDSIAKAVQQQQQNSIQKKQNNRNVNDDVEDDDKNEVELSEDRYRNDQSLFEDGVFDRAKFERMCREYAKINYMMCSLQSLDVGIHKRLLSALAASSS